MTSPRRAGPTLFVVAGEVSGDMHAAELVAELLRADSSIEVAGFGGARMAASGVQVLEDSTRWGVIGHVEPLLRLRAYFRRLERVEAAIRRRRPDVLLLVDFAAFNLRLAERLRGVIPVAYYFPPMVSVRRGDRARKVARLRMRLLATLRPEARAFEAAGGDVVFVGHPVVDLAQRTPDPLEARRRLGLKDGAAVLGLLPGSRLQEIRAHLPVLLEAAARILRRVPEIRVVLPVPPEFRPAAEVYADASRVPAHIAPDVHEAMRSATVLVVAAGTATLEAAVLGVPMVAVYRLPWLSWVIANRVVRIHRAALPNILAGREIVPELLQDRMTPDAVADAVLGLLGDPARREAMRRELAQIAADLGDPGAARRAADEVLRMVQRVAAKKTQA